MNMDPSFDFDLAGLRGAYSRFLASGRVLLTGHSHQAWPDAARDALIASFDDAARLVDDKWNEAVFPKAKAVGEGILERMGFDRGDAIAFGKSTHELVFRLLSALPIKSGRTTKIVTTTSEFHSLRRQLTRLAEEGVEIVWVDAQPRAGIVDRLLEAITPGTAMVAVSAVFFDDAYVLPRLGEVIAKGHDVGAVVVVDAYHAFNVVPVSWGPAKATVFVTSGGYKYAGFGDGLCWLRIPAGTTLRPVYTGWFADFGALSSPQDKGVVYGPGGARFAGGTFDASSLYRARAALATWDRFGLTPARLGANYRRQTRRILDHLDAEGLGAAIVSAREDERRGGFVTVRVKNADAVVRALRGEGVLVDARNETVRIGPAPYLTDDEIDRGVSSIARIIKGPAGVPPRGA